MAQRQYSKTEWNFQIITIPDGYAVEMYDRWHHDRHQIISPTYRTWNAAADWLWRKKGIV